MIAGDHGDADARLPTRVDGGGNARTQRIGETQETDKFEGEIVLGGCVVLFGPHCGLRDRQHAQTGGGKRRHASLEPRRLGRGQMTQIRDRFRRSLRRGDQRRTSAVSQRLPNASSSGRNGYS